MPNSYTYDNLFWEKHNASRKKKEKTPILVDTYFLDSACDTLGPISKISIYR